MRKWQIRLTTEVEADGDIEDALAALMAGFDPHEDFAFDVEYAEVFEGYIVPPAEDGSILEA